MPMTPFIDRIPELGTNETRTVTTSSLQGLPADQYALLELYCDEPGCDCRRVLFSVIARATGERMATINFGWESRDFYKRKLGLDECAREVIAGSLDPMQPQSRHAPVLLASAASPTLTRAGAPGRESVKHAQFPVGHP